MSKLARIVELGTQPSRDLEDCLDLAVRKPVNIMLKATSDTGRKHTFVAIADFYISVHPLAEPHA